MSLLSEADMKTARLLWLENNDTLTIARALMVPEASIYNWLAALRQPQREAVFCDNRFAAKWGRS